MNFERSCGILLHPTSLPSLWGIGDFGTPAHKFIEFLERSGQKYWQVLPLGPTGFGDSPYQSLSAFAGNPLLVSPERLAEEGLLEQSDIDVPRIDSGRVDYGKALDVKGKLLEKAFTGFKDSRGASDEGFGAFCGENSFWLDDYALFRSLKSANGERPWFEWEAGYKRRESGAIEVFKEESADRILFEKFCQYVFFKQWFALKEHAASKGVRIIGDLPLFLSMDSAEVWSTPAEFKLNDDLTPKVVAGVPPDFFSKTGQLWGNPIYDWQRMRDDGFRWWVSRIRHSLKMMDVVRIDHFRGLVGTYEVPGGSDTAEHGEWVAVPGADLFSTLKWVFGELPMIAEDLGFITDDVVRLRESFGIPGMRILQFGFGGDAGNPALPHNYRVDCVAYTGTHDNDTAVGWFDSLRAHAEGEEGLRREREMEFCMNYLGSDGKEIHWDLIRALMASVASLVIVPLQDVLGLGGEARMNTPSTVDGNWKWRFMDGDLTEAVSARLKKLVEVYGR